MAKRDYYDILRVMGGREGAEIGFPSVGQAISSRRQSRDKTAEQKFKEINEAYEALRVRSAAGGL